MTRNGRPHVMVVSVAEWDEVQETLAILSGPQTRADLAEAAEAAERGDFTTEEEMRTARRGTYRVIYKIDEGKHAIEIRTIRHRADAYRT